MPKTTPRIAEACEQAINLAMPGNSTAKEPPESPSDATAGSAGQILYRSAVSGMWYSTRGAAGSIDGVWIDGNTQSSPMCVECEEDTELDGDKWKCPGCGWAMESSLQNPQAQPLKGDAL